MLPGYPAPGVGVPGVLDRVDTSPGVVELHASDRIWTETNCYLDLWIEFLGRLGPDIRPALGPAFRARTDSSQWTFVKPDASDLFRLYRIGVGELNVWRPLLDHVEESLAAGAPLTVEVDSHWLPDTAGVGYRTDHGKTSILPIAVDRAGAWMRYLHNSGCHELRAEDFVAVFGLTSDPDSGTPAAVAAADNLVPLPYVEQILLPEDPVDPPTTLGVETLAAHAAYCDPDAVRPLVHRVLADLPWIGEAGPEGFHLWSFGTLRSAGSTAEVCADACDWLAGPGGIAGVDPAAAAFRDCAQVAKAVQFRLARAARGRTVDPSEGLTTMAEAWSRAAHALTDVLR